MLQDLLPVEIFGYGLVFARIGSAMMLLPGIGEAYVAPRIRLQLAFLISLLIAPLLQESLPNLPASPIRIMVLVGSEVIIGIFIGTVARLLITALATAGTVMSVMGGFGFASLFNPLMPDQGAFTAVLLTLMGVLLIFATNTHHLMIMALVESYTMFAPGAPPMFEDISNSVARLVTSSFRLGIQIAAPFIVVGTIFYLGLGLLARLMPQFQVFFIGLPLQILLGLALLSVTLTSGIMWFLDSFETSMLAFFGPG
jgi:flagellar biosynthesis protein FliR